MGCSLPASSAPAIRRGSSGSVPDAGWVAIRLILPVVTVPTPSSRHTAATSLPSASNRSAVVNFRTTCSGECRFLVAMIIEPSCQLPGIQTLT